MVAYSFAPQFIDPVTSGAKLQTVRADRKRHARPGEPLQLYTGMRTKHCRKLLTPDPVCVAVQHILIAQGGTQPLVIELDHRILDREASEQFAIADGFGGEVPDGNAARRMADFWLKYHGPRCFSGVVIRWKARQA